MGFQLPKKSIIHGTKGHKKAVEDTSSPNKGLLDNLQTGLTAAGMIPGLGNVADIANVGISGARAGYAKYKGDDAGAKKHATNMAINAAAAVPGAGLAVGGAKLGAKAAKGAKALKTAGKTDEAVEVAAKGQKLKKGVKTAEAVTDTTTAAGMTEKDLKQRNQQKPSESKDKNTKIAKKETPKKETPKKEKPKKKAGAGVLASSKNKSKDKKDKGFKNPAEGIFSKNKA